MSLGHPVARVVEGEGLDRLDQRTTTATTRLPHSGSGRPTTSAAATAGCSRSRAATAAAGTFTPPLTTMSSTRPSTLSRPSSSSRPASEVWNQPSTRALRVVAPRRRGSRRRASGPAIRTRPSAASASPTPSSGRPSYTQPPQVSAMPYVATTRTPASVARARSAASTGPPADEHGVERRQRVALRGRVEPAVQLGRHHRQEAAGRRDVGERAVAQDHRPVTGHQRADHHVEARDVRRRQREQPRPGAAEACRRGRRRREHGVAAEDDLLRRHPTSRTSRGSPRRAPPPTATPRPRRRRARRRRSSRRGVMPRTLLATGAPRSPDPFAATA